MAKLLEKTFDIIEAMAWEPQREFTVTEIAETTKLNKATAGRILKNLLARGYAFQDAFRGGYSLGPMAYKLAAKGVFRKDLLDAAQETIKHFAHGVVHESMILACMQGGRRYILVNENGNKEIQPVLDKPWYDDFYYTSTGRMLLAYASQKEIDDYIKKHGLPSPDVWDGIRSAKDLRARLGEIKEAPYLSIKSPKTCFWIGAFPIKREGRFEAALGLTVLAESFKPPRSKELMDRCEECAKEIEIKLAKAYERKG